jgi:hypothetical protein
MNKKNKYILSLYIKSKEKELYPGNILYALIGCLSDQELLEMINDDIPAALRKTLLNLIINDINKKSSLSYEYINLTNRMLEEYSSYSFKRLQGVGYFFDKIYPFSSRELQARILETFLNSEYPSQSIRAFKLINKNWDNRYIEIVEDKWKNYHDSLSAQIIINHFPKSKIRDYYQDLVKNIDHKYYLARLYLKLGKKYIDDLASIDEITYFYVATKLNVTVSEVQAERIFDNNKFDDRIELLIWCFKELNYWNLLSTISEKSDVLISEKNEQIRKSLGI